MFMMYRPKSSLRTRKAILQDDHDSPSAQIVIAMVKNYTSVCYPHPMDHSSYPLLDSHIVDLFAVFLLKGY